MATTASIFAVATEEASRAEAQAWSRFSSARARAEFCVSWLSLQCLQIERVSGGLLLLGPDREGAFTPAAMWPDASRDLRRLSGAAERTLSERRGIVVAADGVSVPVRDQPAHIGYPIEVSGVLHGAVVLEIAAGSEQALQRATRLLHWGSAWLIDRFRQQAQEEGEARNARMGLAMDLVASAMQEAKPAAAALAVVNELSARLKCDRVSIGFETKGRIEVEAISHTAVFDSRMSLVRLIGEAMDEVLDLDTALVFPPRPDEELGAVAHAELARELKDVAVLSVPLLEDSHPIGVLTLERTSGERFDEETIEFCKTAGGLLGPVLSLQRRNERGTLRRVREAVMEKAQLLVGPRHAGAKLIALVIIAVIIFFSLASGTYRVPAKTVVEGAIQRAAVAPFDGHIAQSFVRAGDTVQAGQVLCRLEDRELLLEQGRLGAEREQTLRKQRQALAEGDRGQMMVLAAQIAEADAQISLVNDKLSRATLKAPFDGVVVSGDLNQLVGTPVEQGKLLFQIAPLDAYRVVLQVDERDIAFVQLDQTGELTLSGLPDRRLAFSVQQITPVASQEEGRNYFRVEAHLQAPSVRVRPGMEGVGKITVGPQRLIWIWTHSLVDWARTWIWKQMP
jgi:multidrug resistance efflux pump/GAF domain-containing protein